jgi:hypothetical protein
LLRNPQKARLPQNSTLNALIDNCIKNKNDNCIKATALKEEKAKTKKIKEK